MEIDIKEDEKNVKEVLKELKNTININKLGIRVLSTIETKNN